MATAPILKEHSFSIYDLEMKNLGNSKGEDLWSIIRKMEPAVVDTNSEWKKRSLRESNRAFLIGRTIDNEAPNLEGVLFNQKSEGGRDNVFLVALEPVTGKPHMVIHRLDDHLKSIFSGPLPSLNQIPQEEKARWNDPLKRLQLRDRIIELSNTPLGVVRSKVAKHASSCCGSYSASCYIAELAYTAMLIEIAHKDKKELRKFIDNDENLFGDTTLIQEALLFGASIISKDAHVRMMCSYCGVRCME